ncbi:POK9 protein, partial [Lanius ludovicianus]|nr:POK9 protein [Lanius ludovicianus]
QLRATVSQFGVTSEPVKQMLEFLFNTHLLLPSDLGGIVKLIFTQHQQLLGSLGMDLAASIDITLMTSSPIKIPTGVKGPVKINGRAIGGLLIGRSSATMLGLFVLPGVIDLDYTGEIMIMAHTPLPPVLIKKGQRIAQLVPLPQLTNSVTPIQTSARREKGFGSTGVLTLLTLDLSTRPKKSVELRYQNQTCSLTALLDTGADSSIISPQHWPPQWPLQATTSTITGVRGMMFASRT